MSITYLEPCASRHAATLVGRVTRNIDGVTEQLAVSVLENVDLTTMAGATIVMPPFAEPTTVTATPTNVPDYITGVSWFGYYHLGADSVVIESVASSTLVTGTLNLSTLGYPVGDRTTFDFGLLRGSGRRSQYHGVTANRSTDFTLDASPLIEAVTTAFATSAVLQWDTTAFVGERDAEVVMAVISWEGVRGFIVAPTTNHELSLEILPASVRRPEVPEIEYLAHFIFDESTYSEIISKLEQSSASEGPNVRPAVDLAYWMSPYRGF